VSPAAARRGPYINTGSGPHWIPSALQGLASAFVVAGALAVAVVVTPTVVRVSVAVFSSSSAAQFVGALQRPTTWATLLMCAGLILVWRGYVAHLRGR
jgi:hypothetical protein